MGEEARKIFVFNLDRLMRMRHVTQADIARHMGMTASTVSDWCKGKKYPRVDRMQELAEFLGVPMNYLTSTSNPFELPALLTQEEQQLILTWRAADPTVRALALEMLSNHPLPFEEETQKHA